MQWELDLVKDIRRHTGYDDLDGVAGLGTYNGSRGEFTVENRNALTDYFLKTKDNCRAILEIGVCRNHDQSSTWSFLNNKNDETKYFGIDLDSKSFLNNENKNIFTIQGNSSDIEKNMEIIKSKGVTEFDFIFIDGWHSINQVLIDWEYTKWLSLTGIVGFHDTNGHPGPKFFIESIDTNKWNVDRLCLDDYGISFVWRK